MRKRLYLIKYPQNYMIRNPLAGALILFFFSFFFLLLYHPMNAQRSLYFGFEATMLLYSGITALVAGVSIILLRKIPFFRKPGSWNVLKEVLIIYLVLQLMGLTTFLLAFVLEEPTAESRWNFSTFIDSSKYAFLINIFPFAFFSVINYKFLFLYFKPAMDAFKEETKHDLSVHIDSSLKKESLDFRADELVYAMADGNYVIFHMYIDKKIKKIPIRNSISNIEKQLEHIPYFFRCHRGFIINAAQVASKRGNASGLVLKMNHIDDQIPVSRNKIREFDRLTKEMRS